MTVHVQKFGGSSLADADAIARCADRAVARHLAGDRLVVVVSAMGRTTDTLVDLARAVAGRADGGEYDRLLATGELASCMLMAMAIQARGVRAVALSGPEAGLRCSTTVGGSVGGLTVAAPGRLIAELNRGRVVVVAGFQALGEDGRITTLQRGGSDATAVALAAALAAAETPDATLPSPGECELLTDVDGVFTADPRLVPNASHIDRIGCDDMLDLALSGAGVVQPHAVRLARDGGVPIVVARSSDPAAGGRRTVVDPRPGDRHAVVGCALTGDLCRVRVTGRCDQGRHVAHMVRAFGPYAARLDTLVHAHTGGAMSASLVVPAGELEDVRERAGEAARCLERGRVDVRTDLARVTLVGTAVGRTGDLVPDILTALDRDGIDIAVVTTGPTALGLLVAAGDSERALRAMHRAAGLDRLPRAAEPTRPRTQRAPGDPAHAFEPHSTGR